MTAHASVTGSSDSQPVIEGSAVLRNVGGAGVASRAQDVFYNPIMKHQRDVFVAVIASYKRFPDRDISVALPLEAGGVRAIRLAKEASSVVGPWDPADGASNASHRLSISANDHDPAAVEAMRANLVANGVLDVQVSCQDATLFFSDCEGFDVIDIDPFGSPVPYLQPAIRRLSLGGLLCVTATDTAALCGVFGDACLRRYWATASNDPGMHEWAVRILVRYCQLIGASQDKALFPVLCYKKDHYVRLYLRCEKSKDQSTALVSGHGDVWVDDTGIVTAPGIGNRVGPMYLGSLIDVDSFDESRFRSHVNDGWCDRLFAYRGVPVVVGYMSIPDLCSEFSIPVQPSSEAMVAAVRARGYPAYRSLDEPEAVKLTCPAAEFLSLLREIGIRSPK